MRRILKSIVVAGALALSPVFAGDKYPADSKYKVDDELVELITLEQISGTLPTRYLYVKKPNGMSIVYMDDLSDAELDSVYTRFPDGLEIQASKESENCRKQQGNFAEYLRRINEIGVCNNIVAENQVIRAQSEKIRELEEKLERIEEKAKNSASEKSSCVSEHQSIYYDYGKYDYLYEPEPPPRHYILEGTDKKGRVRARYSTDGDYSIGVKTKDGFSIGVKTGIRDGLKGFFLEHDRGDD